MTEATDPIEPRYLFTDATSLPWRASASVAGVEVKDLGRANGRAMQLVRCRPGVVFPTHRHTGPEFLYILDGRPSSVGNVWVQGGQASRPAGPWTSIFGVRRAACSSWCTASDAMEHAQPLRRLCRAGPLPQFSICPEVIVLPTNGYAPSSGGHLGGHYPA